MLEIRDLMKEDCKTISTAFKEQGWNKPASQYESYFLEQTEGTRKVLIAEYNNLFAGYLTIRWKSDYEPFFFCTYSRNSRFERINEI